MIDLHTFELGSLPGDFRGLWEDLPLAQSQGSRSEK